MANLGESKWYWIPKQNEGYAVDEILDYIPGTSYVRCVIAGEEVPVRIEDLEVR